MNIQRCLNFHWNLSKWQSFRIGPGNRCPQDMSVYHFSAVYWYMYTSHWCTNMFYGVIAFNYFKLTNVGLIIILQKLAVKTLLCILRYSFDSTLLWIRTWHLYSLGFRCQYVTIGSGNDLQPNRQCIIFIQKIHSAVNKPCQIQQSILLYCVFEIQNLVKTICLSLKTWSSDCLWIRAPDSSPE